MITTDKAQLNINVLTQEQYEQAKADEELDADGLYMVPEELSEYTGGGGSGSSLQLLWENQNPSSSFSDGGTLSRTATMYILVLRQATNNDAVQVNMLFPELTTRAFIYEHESGYPYHYYRDIKISGTTMTCGSGYRQNLESGNIGSANNNYAIPVAVYGIN